MGLESITLGKTDLQDTASVPWDGVFSSLLPLFLTKISPSFPLAAWMLVEKHFYWKSNTYWKLTVKVNHEWITLAVMLMNTREWGELCNTETSSDLLMVVKHSGNNISKNNLSSIRLLPSLILVSHWLHWLQRHIKKKLRIFIILIGPLLHTTEFTTLKTGNACSPSKNGMGILYSPFRNWQCVSRVGVEHPEFSPTRCSSDEWVGLQSWTICLIQALVWWSVQLLLWKITLNFFTEWCEQHKEEITSYLRYEVTSFLQ